MFETIQNTKTKKICILSISDSSRKYLWFDIIFSYQYCGQRQEEEIGNEYQMNFKTLLDQLWMNCWAKTISESAWKFPTGCWMQISTRKISHATYSGFLKADNFCIVLTQDAKMFGTGLANYVNLLLHCSNHVSLLPSKEPWKNQEYT